MIRAGPEADALERVGGEGHNVVHTGLCALEDVFGTENKLFCLGFDNDIGILGRWTTGCGVKHEMALRAKDI